jgi:4-hydroxy-tetrahydrodipicolinate synthase
MVLEGNPEYELHFNATDALSTSQKRYAEAQLALFKDWYRSWSKTVG